MEAESRPAEKRLLCRIGLHRWTRVKYEDSDLENPGTAAAWRTICRYCGTERSSGAALFAVVGVAVLVAGIVVALTLHSLLGPILIVGGVMGVGRVAFTAVLTGFARWLSTGTWRQR